MTNTRTFWKSSASLQAIKARATLLRDIREFFFQRNVLEVETPALSRYTVTAPFINSFRVQQGGGYLQTSPEYAMKRLLASGCESIYQICKSFRQGESGSKHNSEFTMLEWYRLGFSLDELLNETIDLLQLALDKTYGKMRVEKISYRNAFIKHAQIDPFNISDDELKKVASKYIEFQFELSDRDDYLDLMLSHCVEPNLGLDEQGRFTICVLTDYPATQCALACVKKEAYGDVAKRFEIYVNGLELTNAYEELTDDRLLATRWENDRAKRMQIGLEDIGPDNFLLNAQAHGMPQCSGIALGIDRLLMLQLKYTSIDSVISFTDERA